MDNKLITLVITLVVGIILTGSLLVPVLSDAQNSMTKTINENENYSHTMDLISDDVTIEIDYTNGGSEIDVTVGSTSMSVDVSTAVNVRTFLFYSDVCMLWVDRISAVNTPVYCLKSTGYTGNLGGSSSVFEYDSTTKEVTLTVNNVETFSDTVEKFAYVYAENAGKYGFYNYGTNFYVNGNDTIEVFRAGGWWGISAVAYSATGKEWYDSTATAIEGMVITADNVPDEYAATLSGTWTDNGNGTYSRSSASTTISYNDGDEDITTTADTHAIAPIEYISYEPNATSSLLGAIPVMVIVALVLAAVGMIYIGRND